MYYLTPTVGIRLHFNTAILFQTLHALRRTPYSTSANALMSLPHSGAVFAMYVHMRVVAYVALAVPRPLTPPPGEEALLRAKRREVEVLVVELADLHTAPPSVQAFF